MQYIIRLQALPSLTRFEINVILDARSFKTRQATYAKRNIEARLCNHFVEENH